MTDLPIGYDLNNDEPVRLLAKEALRFRAERDALQAKLDAIDALPADGPMNLSADTDYRMGHSDGWRDAMFAVARILHPERDTHD